MRGGTRGSYRMTKRQWYDNGGFANPRCWRRQPKGGGWQYWYRFD